MEMVEPVTATLFGVVVLSETLVGPQILGMGLILVTVTALSVFLNSGRPSPDRATSWLAF
ncbi:Permease of the drug/metabolite transporter (DMT) superfamily [Halomonas citrativorans]|uniref:Permease of the drug/metabolite transporter (DMT) superfamily n=1 Tax=Halomonas citrativorans TaxID=2742612 RepID=A0A1R4I0F5_9GAMM|nr:Permease of the drug/metabolite transporter (DMT) superfamily [Halomonas citrativorans]